MSFSLNELKISNPRLADGFVWNLNALSNPPGDIKLHIGCGDIILPGFINIDFLPSHPEVTNWNLLNIWPENIKNFVSMAFSEDVLEHFFYDEQVYILCSMNHVLKTNGIFRVLMPQIDGLISHSQQYVYNEADFLTRQGGVVTGTDLLNYGLRFSGHRWLHNDLSLRIMAEACGFESTKTTCSESTIPELCNLNVRDESNSLSFANDLKKTREIQKIIVFPQKVSHAEKIEVISSNQDLYLSNPPYTEILYELPESINTNNIILLNIRSANLSEFSEHNFSKISLTETEEGDIYPDASLRSCLHSNMVSFNFLRVRFKNRTLSKIIYKPSLWRKDYFTSGPLEIFIDCPDPNLFFKQSGVP